MDGKPEFDLFEAIMNRRTTRNFTSQAIEFERVAEIIQAGMEAPSSGNLQNWRFIVVTEKDKLREMYHHSLEQEGFNTAPIGVIVCSDDKTAENFYGLRGKRLYTIQNCAACIQNMLLAAEAFGIGACWVGAFDEEKVDMIFNIPKGIRAQAFLLFGYADEEPEPKERKEIQHVLYFNKYGETIRRPHLVLRDYSEEWARRIEEQKQSMAQKQQKMPSKEEMQEQLAKASEQTKDFFEEARKKVTEKLDSLKDEEKAKRNI